MKYSESEIRQYVAEEDVKFLRMTFFDLTGNQKNMSILPDALDRAFSEPTTIPYDRAGYMDIAPEDKGENVRREICLTLEQMGIRPECSHHEQGPGQNEIDFRYAEPVKAADDAVTFRTVVNTVALRNGLAADFSPKPLRSEPGNGMHINLSAAWSICREPTACCPLPLRKNFIRPCVSCSPAGATTPYNLRTTLRTHGAGFSKADMI